MADVFLLDYLRAWSRQPFDWRQHNCGHFVAGWLLELTGRQVAGDLLGRFASAAACHRVLRRAGYRDLVGLAAHRLASLARPVASHELGDVVVVNLVPGGPAFALSLGRDTVAIPAPEGLVIARHPVVLAAWRILCR